MCGLLYINWREDILDVVDDLPEGGLLATGLYDQFALLVNTEDPIGLNIESFVGENVPGLI